MMKATQQSSYLANKAVMMKRTPIALAIVMLHGVALAQVAANTTSADEPDRSGLFVSPQPGNVDSAGPGGTPGIGARPYTSFMDRLASPVDKIRIKVAGDNLPADGVQGTDVNVQLLDVKGQPVATDVDVTIEVNGSARILLPGRTTSESGADRGDIDHIQPGVQATAKAGVLQFKLIAPFKPALVTLRITVKGVVEKALVRYVPDLRKMVAVGLIEARLRGDKFNPDGILPVGQNDGFDNEIQGFNREFNAGATNFGGRAALYLKGKIKGDYLLTIAYDSDKDTTKKLFQTIDPNAFYPVYGDSSLRTVDAQSSGKLYVRIDKNLTYLLYGDYTTADNNPARQLSQYSRSLPGAKAHYEEGKVIANAFVAQQSLVQVVDEFPARGVSGPYSVSNPNGVKGSEKVEILVRNRNQTTSIINDTLLTAMQDYTFEPFSGQIVFNQPVPSTDDQGNPVSIRITYEVDQGGQRYMVGGVDARMKLTDSITVGAVAVKDNNPSAPFEMKGLNALVKLGKDTEVVGEIAHTSSVVNTNTLNTNTSGNFANQIGDVAGTAERIELRHSGESLRLRAYVDRAADNFNNPSSGITGGKSDAGVNAAYKINNALSVNGELVKQRDDVLGSNSVSGSVGADLKLSDRFTLSAGVRHVTQNTLTQQTLTGSTCSSTNSTTTTAATTTGYNTGFGINQQGNQNIDPATGQPIVCTPTTIAATTASTTPTSLDTSSLYTRATFKATDKVTLTGEVQKELSTDSSLLYSLGADWRVADKTRIYARMEESHQYSGIYGLGVGQTARTYSVGVDTQYMKDGTVYNEYRLRDTGSGNDVEAAIGLRNGWKLAEGLRMNTTLERTYTTVSDASALTTTGPTGATSASVGLEYTANPLWKGSARLERREDNTNRNWLTSLGAVRKLDRNWSLMVRDYESLVQPISGAADARTNQAQLGFAYRPVDNNRFDALSLVEHKVQDDGLGTRTATDIFTLRANYHPSRPWFISGRLAAKRVDELLLGTVNDTYTAALFGGRVTYDVTNRWSLGALTTVLVGQGGARQYAYGLEVGYTVVDNLMVTLGYNWRGFVDKDLTGSDYVNRGWVLNMRYKFDESLFGKDDPDVNKTLTPTVAPAKP